MNHTRLPRHSLTLLLLCCNISSVIALCECLPITVLLPFLIPRSIRHRRRSETSLAMTTKRDNECIAVEYGYYLSNHSIVSLRGGIYADAAIYSLLKVTIKSLFIIDK